MKTFETVLTYVKEHAIKRKPYRFLPPRKQGLGLCGPSALQMALDSLGISVSQQKLAKLGGYTKKNGTSQTGMIEAARAFVQAQAGEAESLEILGKLATRVPVIVDYMAGPDIKEDGHYVLLDEIGGKDIRMMDSRWGLSTVPTLEFIAHWWDVEPDLHIVRRWGMVLIPKTGKTG